MAQTRLMAKRKVNVSLSAELPALALVPMVWGSLSSFRKASMDEAGKVVATTTAGITALSSSLPLPLPPLEASPDTLSTLPPSSGCCSVRELAFHEPRKGKGASQMAVT